MKTKFGLIILVSVLLTACKEEVKNDSSSSAQPSPVEQPSVTANSVCSVISTLTGATITCAGTSANLTHGSQGATGATGAQGPVGAVGVQGPPGATGAQGPPGNSSSPYLVMIDKNNNQVGSFVAGSLYTVWDDTAGGFLSYNQHTGYVNSLSGSAYLIFLSADCSGQAYLPTATANSNSFPENTITYMNGQLYKIGHSSTTISPGTSYSSSYPSGSVYSNPAYTCVAEIMNATMQGTYSEASPIISTLPIRLSLPVRFERR